MKHFIIFTILILSLTLIPGMTYASDSETTVKTTTTSLNDIGKNLQTTNITDKNGEEQKKSSTPEGVGKSGSYEVTLYKEASSTSEIIIVLNPGDSMIFMDREKDWVKIATDEGIGWADVNEVVVFLGGTSGGTDSIEKTDDKKDDDKKTDDGKTDDKTIDNTKPPVDTNTTPPPVDNNTGTQAPPIDNSNTQAPPPVDNNNTDSGTQAPPIDDTGITNTEEPPVEEPKGIPATVQYTEDVHVRMEKSLASDSPVIVSPGTSVNLLSIEDDWCKIEFEGKTGFVRSYYLGLEKE